MQSTKSRMSESLQDKGTQLLHHINARRERVYVADAIGARLIFRAFITFSLTSSVSSRLSVPRSSPHNPPPTMGGCSPHFARLEGQKRQAIIAAEAALHHWLNKASSTLRGLILRCVCVYLFPKRIKLQLSTGIIYIFAKTLAFSGDFGDSVVQNIGQNT